MDIFYYCHQVLIGGGEFGVFGHYLLQHLFLVGRGGGKFDKVSFDILCAHLVAAVTRLHFAVIEDPLSRICGIKLVRPFSDLCFDARLSVSPLVTGLPLVTGFLFLGLILSFVVGLWVSLSCEHRRACKEEERFVGDCSSGLHHLLLCILKNINIVGDPLYFEVIALHLIMQHQEVEGMATCALCLEVDEKCLWFNVGIKSLCDLELPHPRTLDDGEDELRSLLPRRLVGAAVGSIGFVRRFRAHADDGRGIVINRCVVGANSCWFNEFRSIACCVRCHRPHEANGVVCASRFVVRDLEEDRRHDLPDSREEGVRWMAVY